MAQQVSVVYFAAARELAGCSQEQIVLPSSPTPVPQLVRLLAERHARLGPLLHRMRFAINGELVGDEESVRGGDEIAVLPPVAGGSGPLCEVRSQPLSVDEALAAVRHSGAGGVVVFLGVVRDHADGKSVARLDYEAHPTMAAQEMARVLQSVLQERPEVRLSALHREGQLAIGDLAVVVAASAPHRAEAFAACREAIDRIKERVPIWKKEWAPDGSANWVNLEE